MSHIQDASIKIRSRATRPIMGAAIIALACSLAACGASDSTPSAKGPGGPGGAGPAGSAPPPAEVAVITVQPTDVGLSAELPGRLEASRVAQIRARVPGIVQQRLFREGSDVAAGQPLFRLDAAPYQATLASAQASLAKAQANLTQATALAERYQPLVEAQAVSKQEYANAVAAKQQAEADVAAAKAAIQTAQINLGYANVTAPIAGRIGRSLVTEGALVGQGEATQLAVIQQINPLYVNFTQSANEALSLKRALEQGKLKRAAGAGDAAAINVVTEDGSVHRGKLLFSDLTVDPGTGQVALRAEVPNAGQALLPGLFVRVRLDLAQMPGAILLPQQAVTRNSQGDSVQVVDAEGKVGPRQIKIGSAQNNQWAVLEGLQPGEQVVVEGFQKIRPNAPVKPVPWVPSGKKPEPAKQEGAKPKGDAPAAGAKQP